MKRKGDAHEALSLLFKRDGVPHEMILDNSKKQTQGNFKRKLNATLMRPSRFYSNEMGYPTR